MKKMRSEEVMQRAERKKCRIRSLRIIGKCNVVAEIRMYFFYFDSLRCGHWMLHRSLVNEK